MGLLLAESLKGRARPGSKRDGVRRVFGAPLQSTAA